MVALYVFLQKFPCDFNRYESVQDGRITAEEFSTFTHKHGYDRESSDIFFKTMDTNGNIVYYDADDSKYFFSSIFCNLLSQDHCKLIKSNLSFEETNNFVSMPIFL